MEIFYYNGLSKQYWSIRNYLWVNYTILNFKGLFDFKAIHLKIVDKNKICRENNRLFHC